MNQKKLSTLIKCALVMAALIGLFVYAFILPVYGWSIVVEYPEMENRYLPWLIFLSVTAIPCYAAMVIGWGIASDIGKGLSFTSKNAKRLKSIAILAAADSAYFFIGNVALLFANMSHPGITLFSLAVVLAGIAVTIVAGALSHLVGKAAALQEQSDLTI